MRDKRTPTDVCGEAIENAVVFIVQILCNQSGLFAGCWQVIGVAFQAAQKSLLKGGVIVHLAR